MRMLVTDAPGMLDSSVRRRRVAQRVSETRLQRLDDEPGPVLAHDLFGQAWASVR